MDTFILRWYWRRTIETLRYEGLHILLWRTVKMCLSPLGSLRLATFYQKDLTQPLREIRARVELTLTEATESDIEELVPLVRRRYGPSEDLGPYQKLGIRDTILRRFRRGQRCFVGKIGTQIVHYNWISFHWEESVVGTGCFIHLKDDEALCNDGFTVEACRGLNIHAAVNNQMLLFLQRAGYRRAYTVVATDYKSSGKALHRVGWESSGTMLYFIPRRSEKAWIRRIKGTLDPFVERQVPPLEA